MLLSISINYKPTIEALCIRINLKMKKKNPFIKIVLKILAIRFLIK